MNNTITILNGDVVEGLKTLPDASVQCCVTSPPYWKLRNYNIVGQLGQEKTPEEYVANVVKWADEVKRVLRPDGTFWLNLADTSLDKSLVGIPWMTAFALKASGWKLRQDIIWAKPNPMPESVRDRCTRSHEYIFMFSKSQKYFYDSDAIKNPPSEALLKQVQEGYNGTASKDFSAGGAQDASSTKSRIIENARKKIDKQRGHSRRYDGFNARWDGMTKDEQQMLGSNKRDVWTVATKPFKGAHFATFPPELIRPCILAGSKPGDTVLDPFGGSGTTAMVSLQEKRSAVLVELNPEYLPLINQRCDPYLDPVEERTLAE